MVTAAINLYSAKNSNLTTGMVTPSLSTLLSVPDPGSQYVGPEWVIFFSSRVRKVG